MVFILMNNRFFLPLQKTLHEINLYSCTAVSGSAIRKAAGYGYAFGEAAGSGSAKMNVECVLYYCKKSLIFLFLLPPPPPYPDTKNA